VVLAETRLATTIRDALSAAGFRTELMTSGVRARPRMLLGDLDVAIIDLALPDRPGLELVRDVREAGIGVPLLVMGRDDVETRIAALNGGADDFLGSPFAISELVARCRALVRRARGPRWVALPASEDVEIAGRTVSLTPRERCLFEYLQRRRGDVVSKEELLFNVWGLAHDPASNVIDVHLEHLRDKLAGLPITIETVRGLGVRMTEV
jgi:DNA-binding response OmpR family regulator